MAIKMTDGTTIKTAMTMLDDRCSRLKTRMLSNIEKIGDAATMGTTVVIFPVSNAVFNDKIAALITMPDKTNQYTSKGMRVCSVFQPENPYNP